ncbi:protein artichoke [Vespula squamosa]
MQPPTNHPPTISTYLIFNQLRIVHPQFRPKSRSSVLEPSQNILSNAFSYLVLTIVIEYSIVVVRARSKEEAVCRRGPHKLWLKRATIRLLSYFRRFNRNLRESLLVIF